MSSEYLYWYLVWATPSIRNLGSGTTFAEISGKVARTIPLRLPPRPEQDRIVAAIEEQFSRLDAARRLLVSSLDRIEGMRRAVLDQTHQSNCPQMSLAELASLITDGDHRPPARVASGVPHLTAKHIRNGRLVFEGCTFVSEEGYEQTTRRYLPQAGDVVITCVGTIGETAVVSGDVRFSADRNLAAVRLPDDHFRMTPQYLQMVLSSPSYRQRLTSASGSTAQPHLYLRDLRAIKVPVPDLDDQIEIVRETERGLSLADALAMTVKRSLFRSAQLRRSVLEQAFFGRLVPQDAGDEAATDLLARITAEGVSRPPSRRRRRE
jgi:type I restriction enzyme S subunit